MFGDPTYDVTGRWIPAMSELLPQDAHLTVFVGRNAELRQLITGLDRALEGRGGMFLVSGEPGIGKTRVAEELALGRASAVPPSTGAARPWQKARHLTGPGSKFCAPFFATLEKRSSADWPGQGCPKSSRSSLISVAILPMSRRRQ